MKCALLLATSLLIFNAQGGDARELAGATLHTTSLPPANRDLESW
jgi:hypothetical protein